MPTSPYLMANYGTPVTPTAQGSTPIQGPMPFGQGGGDMFGGDLAGSYQNAYNAALSQNQANYQNILSGYQQTLQQQQGAQQQIAGGYNQLYNQVLSGIQGIGQSQSQAIADAYAQQRGQASQGLIDRGLGNATVRNSVDRGLELDKQKADIALANQVAQLTAGYQSQLGGAGLNYANQAAMQNTGLQNQQLQWMNSVQAQYPNAQAYSQLLQQQGMFDQMSQDRAEAQRQFDEQQKLAQQQMAQQLAFGGGTGTVHPPAPNLGPMGTSAPGGGGGLASVTPFGMGGPGVTAGATPAGYGQNLYSGNPQGAWGSYGGDWGMGGMTQVAPQSDWGGGGGSW